MMPSDVPEVVALQKLAFPPPFSEDLHWDPEHLLRHIELFPGGQFVAQSARSVIGSCSNCIVSEERWQARGSWSATVGGPFVRNHDAGGTTLYGLDIGVHPNFRKIGVGRGFYQRRFRLVESLNLVRYGTACRIPDFRAYKEERPNVTPEDYVTVVAEGRWNDRTLTPLLKFGLNPLGAIRDYMEDSESGNAAALLEWVR